MTMKYSTVKCLKSNIPDFVVGHDYRLFHASHDDVVETGKGRSFGITAQLEHKSQYGDLAFELV
ncbi:hypothetical protein [Yersinia phage vB_YenM_P744]